MATNNEYKAVGSGKRKTGYTTAIVVGAVILATLITLGFVTLDQVNEFIDLAVTLVGILASLGLIVSAAIARKNVEPPSIEPSPEPRHGNAGGPDDYDPRLGGKPKNQV